MMAAAVGNPAANGAIFNAVTNKAVTLNGMVELCAAAAGVEPKIVNYDPKKLPEGVEVKYAVDLEFDGVVFAHASSSFGSAGCFSMAAGSGSGSGAALSRASNFRAVTRRRLSTELIALL